LSTCSKWASVAFDGSGAFSATTWTRLGGNGVIQRRFNVSVLARARSRKNIHASRPFQEKIARPKIGQNE